MGGDDKGLREEGKEREIEGRRWGEESRETEGGRKVGRVRGVKDFARPPLVYSQTNFNIGFRAHLGC